MIPKFIYHGCEYHPLKLDSEPDKGYNCLKIGQVGYYLGCIVWMFFFLFVHAAGAQDAPYFIVSDGQRYGLWDADRQKSLLPLHYHRIERVKDDIFILQTDQRRCGLWQVHKGYLTDSLFRNITIYEDQAQTVLTAKTDTVCFLWNEKGIPLSKQAFDTVGDFNTYWGQRHALACAKHKNKWGVINTTGAWTIPAVYEQFGEIQLGYLPAQKDGKWGITDLNHRILIPFQYEAVEWSDYGIKNRWLCAKKDGKWGVLNILTGKVIHPFEWDSILTVQGESLICGYKDGIIQTRADKIFHPNARPLLPEASYRQKGTYYTLTYDLTQEKTAPQPNIQPASPSDWDDVPNLPRWEGMEYTCFRFRKAYLVADYDPLLSAYRYGLTDTTGKSLLPCRYNLRDDIATERYHHADQPYLLLQNNAGKWGVYGLQELRWLFECEYDDIHTLGRGILWLEKKGQIRWASAEGTLISYAFAPLSEAKKQYGIYLESDFPPPLLWYKNTPIAVRTGKQLTAIPFDRYRTIGNDSLYLTELKRKKGILDRWGRTILPNEYDSIAVRANHYYLYRAVNKRWGIADEHGNVIIPCQYDSVRYIAGHELFLAFSKEMKNKVLTPVFTLFDREGTEQYKNKVPPVLDAKRESAPPTIIENPQDNSDKTFIVNGYGRKIAEYPVKIWRTLDNGRLIVEKEGFFGLMDSAGKWLLATQFRRLDYYNGFYFTEKGRESVIYDESLREIIRATDDYLGIDAVHQALTRTASNGTTTAYDFRGNLLSHDWNWGQNDPKRTLVSAQEAEEKSLIIEKRKKKFGALNDAGRIIIPFQYDSLWLERKLKYTFSALQLEHKKGKDHPDTIRLILKKDGTILFRNPDFQLTDDRYASDYGLYGFQPNNARYNEQGLISADGKVILPPVIDVPRLETETGLKNVLFYQVGERFGIWNGKSKKGSSPTAHEIQKTSGNYFPYRIGELWGLQDADGKTVLLPEWDEIRFFTAEDALVRKNGKQGWFRSGRLVIPPDYEAMGILGGNEWMKVKTTANAGWKLLHLRTGTFPERTEYDNLYPLINEPIFYCTFERNGKTGLLRQGERLFDARFDRIERLRGEFFKGITGRNVILLNGKTGTESTIFFIKIE
jgi:hypothetical protein